MRLMEVVVPMPVVIHNNIGHDASCRCLMDQEAIAVDTGRTQKLLLMLLMPTMHVMHISGARHVDDCRGLRHTVIGGVAHVQTVELIGPNVGHSGLRAIDGRGGGRCGGNIGRC